MLQLETKKDLFAFVAASSRARRNPIEPEVKLVFQEVRRGASMHDAGGIQSIWKYARLRM